MEDLVERPKKQNNPGQADVRKLAEIFNTVYNSQVM
jgi:hypothetical protein